ncbi:unnamed protein product [Cochlearia groenlandica]
MEEQSMTIDVLAFRQDEYAAQQAKYTSQQAEFLAAMKTSNQRLEALTLQTKGDQGEKDFKEDQLDHGIHNTKLWGGDNLTLRQAENGQRLHLIQDISRKKIIGKIID